MKTISLDIAKVVAYIEDYCAVLAFASDLSDMPENYLALTRETEQQDGGEAVGDFEWDLALDFDGEIQHLTDYELCSQQMIKFYFDVDHLCLTLNILDEQDINIEQWLELIFKK